MGTYHGPIGRPRRTYTPEQFNEARAAWDAGDFSDEWKPWRHMAAMEAGVLFPPDGTKWDSWGDDSPSQRAMLIRAIRETPGDLERAIRRAKRPTWGSVIEGLLMDRDQKAGDVERLEREDTYERLDDISPRQAADTLRRIGMVINGTAPR